MLFNSIPYNYICASRHFQICFSFLIVVSLCKLWNFSPCQISVNHFFSSSLFHSALLLVIALFSPYQPFSNGCDSSLMRWDIFHHWLKLCHLRNRLIWFIVVVDSHLMTIVFLSKFDQADQSEDFMEDLPVSLLLDSETQYLTF